MHLKAILAISHLTGAANGKLARLLRKIEEDNALIRAVRGAVQELIKTEAAKRPRIVHASWRMAPDFSTPLPRSDRPTSATGATSFHFEVTTINRTSTVAVNKRAGSHAPQSSPIDHARYIERPDAIGPAELHGGYLERDGAAGPAALQVFSNISDDPERRLDYWRVVEAHERVPGAHRLTIDQAKGADWCKAAIHDPALPDSFRAHCRAERDRYLAHLAAKQSRAKAKAFKATPFKTDAEQGTAILTAAQAMPSWQHEAAPLRLSAPRAGCTQYRFVIELPPGLDAAGRAELVGQFCDYLGSFARRPDGTRCGMMYTAVIHRPEPGTDRRNYHLHVIAHDRPAQFLEQYGQWDFAVAEDCPKRGPSRRCYPHRQNKIGEVSRKLPASKCPPHYNNAIAGQDFLPHLRRHFAELSNAMLAAKRLPFRFDPRSYADMGIDQLPALHLGSAATAHERAGVSTVGGRYNAAVSWQAAERADMQAVAAIIDDYRAGSAPLERIAANRAGSADAALYLDLLAERAALIDALEQAYLELRRFDRLHTQVRSRAEGTIAHCDLVLAGSVSKTKRPLVEDRRRTAVDHLAMVAQTIAPERAGVTPEEGEPTFAQLGFDRLIQKYLTQAARRIDAIDTQLYAMDDAAVVAARLHARQIAAVADMAKNDPPVAATGLLQQAEALPGVANKALRRHGPIHPSPPTTALPTITMPAATDPSGKPDDLKTQISSLIDRIARERMPVYLSTDRQNGTPTVPSLGPEQKKLLATPYLAGLVRMRLHAIAKQQAYERARLIRWLARHGATQLRHYGLGFALADPPRAVATRWQHWREHPDIVEVVVSIRTPTAPPASIQAQAAQLAPVAPGSRTAAKGPATVNAATALRHLSKGKGKGRT